MASMEPSTVIPPGHDSWAWLPLGTEARARVVSGALAERDADAARELVRLLDAAASEPDIVARYARFADIEHYLHEQSLVLPIIWNRLVTTEFVRDTVRGYDPQPYGGSTYGRVWVDSDVR